MTQLIGRPMRILQTLVTKDSVAGEKVFYVKEGKAYAICGQGLLRVVRFELDGTEMSAEQFSTRFGAQRFEFNC
jgi:methionyl-tRNA formyltransferase